MDQFFGDHADAVSICPLAIFENWYKKAQIGTQKVQNLYNPKMVGGKKTKRKSTFCPYLRPSVSTGGKRLPDDSDLESPRSTKSDLDSLYDLQSSIDPLALVKEAENSGGIRYNSEKSVLEPVSESVSCRFNCGACFDYYDIDGLEDHEDDHVNIINLKQYYYGSQKLQSIIL
jgi:hypothetical protein